MAGRPPTSLDVGEGASSRSPSPRQRAMYSEHFSPSAEGAAAVVNPNAIRLAPIASTRKTVPSPTLKMFKGGPVASVSTAPMKRTEGPEPRVSAPFKRGPGQAPRRIEIQRRKVLYQEQNVGALLKGAGIDYSKYTLDTDHKTGRKAYLPLEVFDDTEYETRTVDEWLGTTRPCQVVARALRLDQETGLGTFEPCTVTGTNGSNYIVRFDGDPADERQLHRLHILFGVEDPSVFVERVASAHRTRREFEARTRYGLYIDSMPIDEMQPIDSEQANRILNSALNTQALKQNALDSTSLIGEVNTDFARTMNKIIFDRNLNQPSQAVLRESLAYVPEQKRAAPEYAVVKVAPYDFNARFNDFSFHCLLVKNEVIVALHAVRLECNHLLNLSMFNTHISKTIAIDEFEQLQSSSLAQLHTFLTGSWVTALKSAVKTSLATVGKGWFNLEERNLEVYMFSKLRKFMLMINFIMEDTLHTLIEHSLREYVRFFEAFTVDGQFPLFSVELTVRDGKIGLSTKIEALEELPLALFDRGLSMLHDIPQLEPLVMENLFRSSHKGKLASIQRQTPWVQDFANRITACVNKALQPLKAYVATYDQHQEFLALNVDEYVAKYFETSHTIEDVRSEVERQHTLRRDFEASIPLQSNLGLCVVSSEAVRRELCEKRTLIATRLLETYCHLTRERCVVIAKDFNGIRATLQRTPANIEALVEMREHLALVPKTVTEQKPNIEEVLARFAMLEEFGFRFTKDDFGARWDTFALPKTIADQVASVNAYLDEQKSVFEEQVTGRQKAFEADAMDLDAEVRSFGQYNDLSKIRLIADKARNIELKIAEYTEKAKQFNSDEMHFGREVTDYSRVKDLSKQFQPYSLMWSACSAWKDSSTKWRTGSFLQIKPDEVARDLENYQKDLNKAIKAPQIKENNELNAIASNFAGQMKEFEPLLPLIEALGNPGMRQRHWDALSAALAIDLHPDETFTLDQAINKLKLQERMDVISKEGERAGKEYMIEQSLNKMQDAWANIRFDVVPYKTTGTYIVKGTEVVMALLDEHRVMTQAMQFSTFKGPFEERISNWDHKLQLVSDVLEVLLMVQVAWLYLRPIFDSADILKQLPVEGKRFSNVNRMWRTTMANFFANPDVLVVCDDPTLLAQFQEGNKQLEIVQKGLSDYLDSKRGAFARFYFLSNDELLQILSQAKDPTAVQPHLKKCFENVTRLEFNADGRISAMFSAEKERVDFKELIDPSEKNVENWLSEVEDMMRASVKKVINDSVADYLEKTRSDWVKDWPAQCVLTGSQIHWTRECEQALRQDGHNGVKKFLDLQRQQLSDMVTLVRGNLTPLQRMTIGALIVLDVHARDVISRMVDEGVSAVTDFGWISQMRYYVDPSTSQIAVQMVQARFDYAYEYLGNSLRLVITPLTERCYMTLMTALQLHLGGAPAGPAGTGKTETVKDLAKCVAIQCVVFNCSDSLDHIAMGKFFKGLASSGAWACFDEFNRIDIEVLSVVAQQVQTIWNAVRAKVDHFVFEDCELRLRLSCCAFITMNPGYAGRTELPDNLAALFRPVAMMVPDYALIAEIMLYSFGFSAARALSLKMVATFKLCSEQLSAQDHYDYGMRAVKTVITQAGILKRKDPQLDENVLLLRALRDVNVPKFLVDDLPLFEGIISDLFPGIAKPDIDYGALMNAIIASAMEAGLQPVGSFCQKSIQLFETAEVRHGLMVVGPTGGGKTGNIATLQKALNRLADGGLDEFLRVKTHVLNPKSIKMGQLYGQFDEATHEWTDGILAFVMRQCCEPSDVLERYWIVFDGPVDALWIENMNTVLDDNKKLCLNSGEIIQMPPTMTMIFEVEDLSVASPATVSRCGMVYMDPEAIGLRPLVASWLQSLPKAVDSLQPMLLYLFDTYVETAIAFMRRNLVEPVPTVNTNLVQAATGILDCFFAPYRPVADKTVDESELAEKVERLGGQIGPLFLFALIWSVGATTNEVGRQKFDQWLRLQLDLNGFERPPPESGLVYDFVFDLQTDSWRMWMTTVPEYVIPSKSAFQDIIVPTVDSVRYTFLLDLHIRHGKHVLFTGNTGTGKTVNVTSYLATMPAELQPISLIFSAATSSNQVQDILDAKMEKRRQRVYGPPIGKTYVVLVDDMNMPAREKYFAQPPIELLRQWMDHSGWYDLKTLQFNKVVDLIFIGAMGPPGGGRNPVTGRFLRHFTQVNHTDLSSVSLQQIFLTILRDFLQAFPDEIQVCASALVTSTVEIYKTIAAELLPTPSKSHYTFNLRDLSKVFQGILNADPRRVADVDALLRLWIHENRRVFADRMVNATDQDWFTGLLTRLLKENFGKSWLEVVTNPEGRVLFGDYMGGSGADVRVYDEITDMDKLVTVMEEYLEEYNSEKKNKMKLVMFIDAIEHVSRICRILRQPQGNALLLGVGGSGRQSLTRLAAFMGEYDLFQIEVSKSYDMNAWHDDLRKCLLSAGLQEKQTVFLMSDTQIVKEAQLEDINNVLNSGDVPNLYNAEDMEAIINACRVDCQRRKVAPTKSNIYASFVARVRTNLHICLCMSPMGDAFRTRLRMFPALVNCCTIDWFSPWPAEALRSVALSSLTEDDLSLGTIEPIVNMFVAIHQSVERNSIAYAELLRRHNYVTPTSYLEVLSTFKRILAIKRKEVGGLRDKLQNGVDKLEQSAEAVAKLQVELVNKQPILIKTQEEVETMMKQISVDKKDADATREVVSKQEADAQTKAAECKAIKDDAQKDLDLALPALEEAVSCLKLLKKSDLDEVKAMKKPPAGVLITVQATCILFNIPPIKKNDPDNVGKKINDYWEPASTKLFKDAKKFLDMLMTYDKDNIPTDVIEKIKPFMEREDFTPLAIEKASKACKAICQWVRAMFTYDTVAKNVEPKRIALRAAEQELERVNAALAEAVARLQSVEGRIAALEANYMAAVQKKEALASEVAICKVKLVRAEKLVGGLGGERRRWSETVKDLTVAYTRVTGDILVSAGSIAYLGAFTGEFRNKIVKEWHDKLAQYDIVYSAGCTVSSTLGNPVAIRSWNLFGLPTDTVSIENGIIMARSVRWPLLIDPQGQANKFVKGMGKSLAKNGMDVVKLTDNFTRTLENAIRFGKWVLIENIGNELDPALEPVLLRQTFPVNGVPHITIGDATIPYSGDFQFYMTTKLPNPHYSPELQVKVTLLNFTITRAGLQDQMLGIVVSKESPELETKKNRLVVSNNKMKEELQEIEDKILKLLSSSQGDILDDEELIDTLASSQSTSREINEKVAEAEIVEKEIDISRAGYIPVAFRASLLYFCIADLANIDPMYQYSLQDVQWFVNLFLLSIENAIASDVLTTRLLNLNAHFTRSLYEAVCRSVFERHKPLFSFLICTQIMQGDNLIDPDEWRFLVGGGAPTKNIERPASWIAEDMWQSILALSDLPNFSHIEQSFLNPSGLSVFKTYCDASDSHHQPLPVPFDTSLSPFQKLLVLKCLRPSKMRDGIEEFIINQMGREFTEPPAYDLAGSFSVSTYKTPLVFVLSPGADPAEDLMKFAEDMGMKEKLKSTSLGKGQGVIAERYITAACRAGGWVLLQNCHLAISWLPTLEMICESLVDRTDVSPQFRLWLTSLPTPKFPVSILQDGVKMTNEPPKGLRANLTRSYLGFTDEFLNDCNKPSEFKTLTFALCLFHANILERRKFGPLGWNIPYRFTESDLQVCISQLRDFINMFDEIPYQVIHFLTYDINYGGRVTDDIDRRTIRTILDDFVTPQALRSNYSFSASGHYHSIPAGNREDYLSYIRSLPSTSDPEAFGLHDNADISYAREETNSLFACILSILPRVSSGTGKSRESIVADVATRILATLPAVIDIESVTKMYPTSYTESMNTVLVQEAIRYNRLLVRVKETLIALGKALKGEMVMTAELESMADSLFKNQVPDVWSAVAYPSLLNLSSWVNDLHARMAFINGWIKDGTPAVFWISGFFFPQAFLTGTLQNYARRHVKPIDSVSFSFRVMPPDFQPGAERVADGCLIRGLYLEGARWDPISESLADSTPKELYVAMPTIWLVPVVNRVEPKQGVYSCPVYKILTRTGTLSTTGHSTNFIMFCELPSLAPPSKWVKAGVALFCGLRY
ncbi:AAA+ ATPase domain-containing protein [Plasmodiophora brassicae]